MGGERPSRDGHQLQSRRPANVFWTRRHPQKCDILATVCGQLAGGRGPQPGYDGAVHL